MVHELEIFSVMTVNAFEMYISTQARLHIRSSNFHVKIKIFFFFLWEKKSWCWFQPISVAFSFFFPNEKRSFHLSLLPWLPLTTRGKERGEKLICLGPTTSSLCFVGICAWDICLWAKETTIIPSFASSKTFPEFPVASTPTKILQPLLGDGKHPHWFLPSSSRSGTLPPSLVSLSQCLHCDLLSPGYIILGPVKIYNYFVHSLVCVHICAGSFYTRVHMEHIFYALYLICKNRVSHWARSLLIWLDRLASEPQGLFCLCLPSAWDTGTWLFDICVGDWTQVLLLVWQALFCLYSTVPAPH